MRHEVYVILCVTSSVCHRHQVYVIDIKCMSSTSSVCHRICEIVFLFVCHVACLSLPALTCCTSRGRHAHTCVHGCEGGGDRTRKREKEREKERKKERECVCVLERERKRERDRGAA